jgi:hypothetical protein
MFERYIASVSYGYCKSSLGCCICYKRLFKMFHLFLDVCCKHFYLDIAYVSHLCCKGLFEMFQLFQSYVEISVFMLPFAIVLFGCCICFTHMLQLYIPNVSSVSVVCCIQEFHVSEVERPGGARPRRRGWGAASHGSAIGARSAPRILWTGRARPHAGSRIPRGLFRGRP